jgi:hypothetical protein
MTAPEDQNGLREALARADQDDIVGLLGKVAQAMVNRGLHPAAGPVRRAERCITALRTELDADRASLRAAEAEITRLKEGMEALGAKAEGQIAYWRERQAAEKSLEDGVSEDGLTYTPMGDHAAWQAGYCNGRMSEADWWRWTLKELATLSPEEHPHG